MLYTTTLYELHRAMEEAAAVSTCKLAGGPFENLVQMLLGFIALSVLAVKRCREHPPRPVIVWLYDASKQGIGALVAHIANMIIAIILSQKSREHGASSDEVTNAQR